MIHPSEIQLESAKPPPDRSQSGVDQWSTFGFINVRAEGERIIGALPQLTIGFRTAPGAEKQPLTTLLMRFGIPPSVTIKDDAPCSLFKMSNVETIERLKNLVPEGAELVLPGTDITLPSTGTATYDLRVQHLSEIASLDVPDPAIPTAAATNHLRQFSLHGRAAEMEAKAQACTPLLGDICLSGQSTVWYAAPNVGKTLCALRLMHDAITDGRIAAGDTYYFNADDSSSGLARKLHILDELGAHMIVPGYKGFRTADLINHLRDTANKDEARGTLVVVDTIKKFTSLMDKRLASDFADACRQFTIRGGTVLGLAHTAKNANPDGSPRYSGTTDLVEDFDAAYTLAPLSGVGEPGERLIEFRAFKRRGDNAELVVYAYSTESGVSYEEKLLSVRVIDPATVDEFKRLLPEQDDQPTIEAITALIGEGVNQRLLLAKAAAKRAEVSERAAIRVLDRYTGAEPGDGRWSFSVKARGAKVYDLITPAPS